MNIEEYIENLFKNNDNTSQDTSKIENIYNKVASTVINHLNDIVGKRKGKQVKKAEILSLINNQKGGSDTNNLNIPIEMSFCDGEITQCRNIINNCSQTGGMNKLFNKNIDKIKYKISNNNKILLSKVINLYFN